MYQATVVYYTSNREDEQFELKIRERLLASIGDDCPLISVSQKPIDFGYNICVGDVGVSNQNVFRQLLIGAEQAHTPFIISAEADCIYPKEYFQWVPPVADECFRNDHVFILSKFYGGFYQKSYSECAQICGREYLMQSIEEYLEGKPFWSDVLEHGHQAKYLFGKRRWKFFHTDIPVINIKTDHGMHKKTGTIPGTETPELQHWGSAESLRKELFGG